jgi:hypothetical protein
VWSRGQIITYNDRKCGLTKHVFLEFCQVSVGEVDKCDMLQTVRDNCLSVIMYTIVLQYKKIDESHVLKFKVRSKIR